MAGWIFGAVDVQRHQSGHPFARAHLGHYLKGQAVRVDVVSPGMIITPATETCPNDNPGAGEGLTQPAPFRQIGEPDDIAAAVKFLASSESR